MGISSIMEPSSSSGEDHQAPQAPQAQNSSSSSRPASESVPTASGQSDTGQQHEQQNPTHPIIGNPDTTTAANATFEASTTGSPGINNEPIYASRQVHDNPEVGVSAWSQQTAPQTGGGSAAGYPGLLPQANAQGSVNVARHFRPELASENLTLNQAITCIEHFLARLRQDPELAQRLEQVLEHPPHGGVARQPSSASRHDAQILSSSTTRAHNTVPPTTTGSAMTQPTTPDTSHRYPNDHEMEEALGASPAPPSSAVTISSPAQDPTSSKWSLRYHNTLGEAASPLLVSEAPGTPARQAPSSTESDIPRRNSNAQGHSTSSPSRPEISERPTREHVPTVTNSEGRHRYAPIETISSPTRSQVPNTPQPQTVTASSSHIPDHTTPSRMASSQPTSELAQTSGHRASTPTIPGSPPRRRNARGEMTSSPLGSKVADSEDERERGRRGDADDDAATNANKDADADADNNKNNDESLLL